MASLIVTGKRGFTLIELLVVMAILALLLTLAAPRYFGSVDRARDAILRSDLSTLRQSIDKYYGDNGKYPATLNDLVSQRYLRAIPEDPVTGNATSWVIIPPDDPQMGNVYDIKSGAPGKARDGTLYAEW
ncbi:MAG: prepilin-type N-terminal cleavage/methylation domain-containing protein [Nitrosomonadales bacterium]|nr:prepilin-type N-terminal cleavage/methylation domain-containing protein [Nitrosomonadales bacterium]